MNLSSAPNTVRQATLADCSAAARILLREREDRYPALVEAGKLDAAAAGRGLSLGRALVAQWAWIVDPARPPLPDSDGRDFGGHYNHDLVVDTRSAAEKAAHRAKLAPHDQRAARLAVLYEALAWFQQGHAGCPCVARIVMAVDVERSRSITSPSERAA